MPTLRLEYRDQTQRCKRPARMSFEKWSCCGEKISLQVQVLRLRAGKTFARQKGIY
jgi:hypothetical protein